MLLNALHYLLQSVLQFILKHTCNKRWKESSSWIKTKGGSTHADVAFLCKTRGGADRGPRTRKADRRPHLPQVVRHVSTAHKSLFYTGKIVFHGLKQVLSINFPRSTAPFPFFTSPFPQFWEPAKVNRSKASVSVGPGHFPSLKCRKRKMQRKRKECW